MLSVIIPQPISVDLALSGFPDQVRRISMHTPTNSSVQNTSLENSRVLLDWLQFHLPNNDKSWAFIRMLLPDFTIPEDGGSTVPGFTHSGRALSSGVVAWSENRLDKPILVRLPATALALLNCSSVEVLIDVLFAGGIFSRLDFAIDAYDNALDMQEIIRKLESYEVQTRWKKFRPEYSDCVIGAGGFDGRGLTVYVGRRSSESFLRVYDKTEEQRAKLERQGNYEEALQVPDGWVRVELESKKRKAHALGMAVVEAIIAKQSAAAVITQHLRSLIDFKDSAGDSNRSRWATSDWWLAFLEGAAKVAVRLPDSEPTIAKLQAWIQHIAPALAVMMSVDVEWLLGEIADGVIRFREKHKCLLKQAGVPLPEVVV